jgi:N,N'-diacetyllegionaminate synthase
MSNEIMVGTKTVKEGSDPYIIAEIGSNFLTLDDCVKSVKAARLAGADCAKFQIFTFKDLYGLSAENSPQWYNKKSEFPVDWLQPVKEAANSCGIDLMFSCFQKDMPRYIDHFVSAHKIASSEITNVELLEAVACLGKPIFLSTGGATGNDIELALSILEGCKIIINYCVGAYPAHYTNLYKIDKLRKFGHLVGFSDHSLDPVYLALSAVRNHKAVSIERHFNAVGANGPDAMHSFNPAQFMNMVDYLKGRKEAFVGPTAEEVNMIMCNKRRLVALKSIKKGQTLSWSDNFGGYRSLTPENDGISPFAKEHVDGKIAKRDILQGRSLTRFDFEE